MYSQDNLFRKLFLPWCSQRLSNKSKTSGTCWICERTHTWLEQTQKSKWQAEVSLPGLVCLQHLILVPSIPSAIFFMFSSPPCHPDMLAMAFLLQLDLSTLHLTVFSTQLKGDSSLRPLLICAWRCCPVRDYYGNCLLSETCLWILLQT